MLCLFHICSLLARIDYIGCVDKTTGKAELRLFINGIEKLVMRNYFPINNEFFRVI
jgi:hypothetical protein